MARVRYNLPTLQALSLLFMFDLTVPLRQTIYSQAGLAQTQIGLLIALTWFVVLCTDMPTGRLADEYSYKFAMVAGCVMLTASFVVLALANNLWGFALAAALLGLGTACYRGVPQALSSLTLGELRDPTTAARYARFVRWVLAFAALGEAMASFVALGVMGRSHGLRSLILLQAGVYAVMGTVALAGLTDIRPHGLHTQHLLRTLATGWKATINRIRHTLTAAPLVRSVVLYGACINCSTMTMVWLSQVYLERTGTPAAQVPLVWGIYHLALFGFAFLAGPYERHLGRWTALALLPIIVAGTYVSLVWVHPAVGKWLVVVFYFVRAMQMGILTVYVISLVPERMRATIIGVMSTLQFMLFSVMNVAIQASVDLFVRFQHGTGAAFGLSALVYGVGGLALVWQVRKHQGDRVAV